MNEQERIAFEGRLNDNWTDTVIAYDNVPFTPSNVPFIRVTVSAGISNQETLGQHQLHRRTGVCIIQVFVQSGTGTKKINDYVDDLCDLFRSVQIGTITCLSPYSNRVGDDGRGWYQINVIVPYTNEVLKEII